MKVSVCPEDNEKVELLFVTFEKSVLLLLSLLYTHTYAGVLDISFEYIYTYHQYIRTYIYICI